jgi:hypothetical protein
MCVGRLRRDFLSSNLSSKFFATSNSIDSIRCLEALQAGLLNVLNAHEEPTAHSDLMPVV